MTTTPEPGETRIVGSTPKGRALVAIADVLEAEQVPGFTGLANEITERLFADGLVSSPAIREGAVDLLTYWDLGYPPDGETLDRLRRQLSMLADMAVAVCVRCSVSPPAIETPWCRQCLEDVLADAIGPSTARDALEALERLVAKSTEDRLPIANRAQLEALGDALDTVASGPPAVSAVTHPETQRVWVDGMVIDAVVIHREWVRYQRAAMARHPEDQPLVGGRSAAPTRDEIRAVIAGEHRDCDPGDVWLEEGPSDVPAAEIANWQLNVDGLTDAVLDLLSRSAAEPPEDVAALRSIARRVAAGWTLCIDNLDMVAPYWSNTDADVDLTPAERAVIGGVAAEPNEEAADGR